jgi:hypothetical protein
LSINFRCEIICGDHFLAPSGGAHGSPASGAKPIAASGLRRQRAEADGLPKQRCHAFRGKTAVRPPFDEIEPRQPAFEGALGFLRTPDGALSFAAGSTRSDDQWVAAATTHGVPAGDLSFHFQIIRLNLSCS